LPSAVRGIPGVRQSSHCASSETGSSKNAASAILDIEAHSWKPAAGVYSNRSFLKRRSGLAGYRNQPGFRTVDRLNSAQYAPRVTHRRRIHWGLVILAAFLAEISIMVIFFTLLALATLAGVPELARPESTLDLIDAMVASFVMMFLFTLWVAKRIESDYVLHGALIGLTAAILFTTLILVLSGSPAQHPLYLVAHGLKIAGGITGGLVANKRGAVRRAVVHS
jgi:hypothetical protein